MSLKKSSSNLFEDVSPKSHNQPLQSQTQLTQSQNQLQTQQIQSQASNNDRLFDYFVISGLDIDSGLEPNNLSSSGSSSSVSLESNHCCSPLDQSYKCKVLQHYPESIVNIPFDSNAVCMLSLPNGLKFQTQKNSRNPKIHNFIITKENGEYYYGTSFIFYELVTNKKIKSAIQILQSMYLTELSNGTHIDSTGRYIDSNGCTVDSNGRPIDSNSASNSKKNKKTYYLDNNSQSLPRHFKLSTANSCSSSSQQKYSCSYYDYNKDNLYVCKSLCLLSQYNYVQVPYQILSSMYTSWTSRNNLSVESYVYYVLYELYMPKPGSSLSFINYPNIESHILTTCNYELNFFDYPIRQIFLIINIEIFLTLYTCILLEKQIIICSSNYQKLNLIIESLNVLLFPFKWVHVYVPILPNKMNHFLDAPVPYIMGINNENYYINNIINEYNICYINIDTKHIQIPDDLPNLPQKNEYLEDINGILNKYNTVNIYYKDIKTQQLNNKHLIRKHSWSNELDDDLDIDDDSLLSNTENIYKDNYKTISNSYKQHKKNHELYQQQHHAREQEDHQDENNKIYHSISNYSLSKQENNEFNNQTSTSFDQYSSSINDKNFINTSDFDENSSSSEYNISNKEDFNININNKEDYCKEIKFNIEIREIFIRKFINIFYNYDTFIIQNTNNKLEWLNSRESMLNYDKTSFLSDQSKHFIPFLSLFLDTQMFVSFIDNKISQSWGEMDNNLLLFDYRIKKYNKIINFNFNENNYLLNNNNYFNNIELNNLINSNQYLIEKRFNKVNKLKIIKEINKNFNSNNIKNDNFPNLDINILNNEYNNRNKKKDKYIDDNISLYKKPNFIINEANPLNSKFSNTKFSIALSENESKMQTRNSDDNLNNMAEDISIISQQTNWNFVEKLLKDIKIRTKKMLVEKLGNELIDLGQSHSCCKNNLLGNDHSISKNNNLGQDHSSCNKTDYLYNNYLVEENTLIAGLCDLIEKIMSHGLHNKQNKSSLWNFICLYIEIKEQENSNSNIITNSVNNLLGRSPKMNRKLKNIMNTNSTTLPKSLNNCHSNSMNSTTLPKSFIGSNKEINKIAVLDLPMYNKTNWNEKPPISEKPNIQDKQINDKLIQEKTYLSEKSIDKTLWSDKQVHDKTYNCDKSIQEKPPIKDKPYLIDKSLLISDKPPLPKKDIMSMSYTEKSSTSTPTFEKTFDFNIANSSMYKAMTSSLERNKKNNFSCNSNATTPTSSPFERNSRKLLKTNSEQRSHSESRINNNPENINVNMKPLSNDILYDVNNIKQMKEIKTPIGFARAWVRLSLERKLLSKHLKTLLSNTELLKLLYKRYAFLRCEEEKEQFLYHLLSLNAVDYNCFTNIFINTNMTYRVLIIPSKKSNLYTSSNCWISVSGHLGETKKINLPKNTLEFMYNSKNLGQLSILKIGHDNTGINNKWLINKIIVRNEITNSIYQFICNKWLGKGIDDDAIERILIGEKIYNTSSNISNETCNLNTTPSSNIQNEENVNKKYENLSEILEIFNKNINNIIQYFDIIKTNKNKSNLNFKSLTVLLLGDYGFINCFEFIFLYGFKSSRIFSRNLTIWDLIIKIYEEYKNKNNYNKRLSQSFDDLNYESDEINNIRDNSNSAGDTNNKIIYQYNENDWKQTRKSKDNTIHNDKYIFKSNEHIWNNSYSNDQNNYDNRSKSNENIWNNDKKINEHVKEINKDNQYKLSASNENIWNKKIKQHHEQPNEKINLWRRNSENILDKYNENEQENKNIYKSNGDIEKILHKDCNEHEETNQNIKYSKLQFNYNETMNYFINLISLIEKDLNLINLGRFGKFQLFLLLCFQHKMLDCILIYILKESTSVNNMYEINSIFNRNQIEYFNYLIQKLQILNQYQIHLENSLIYGINYKKIMQFN